MKSFISKLKKRFLLQRILKKIYSFFFLYQWIVLITPSIKYKSLNWSQFKPLMPPKDRIWADPFIWEHENKYYVFIEEMFYSTNRGRIACLTLDKELNILSNQAVLERPYHLSYPFLFEYDQQLYMVPETKQNNSIELYQCTNFPNKWEYVKSIAINIRATDTTLIESNNKWWMFTSIEDQNNATTWDNLHIYFSDSPLSENWTSHPLNPVKKDLKSARSAGRIFLQNGELIRPSQDCSKRYGYAINFNRIVSLSESDYAEILDHIFKPQMFSKFYATHTFNEKSDLIAIDAALFRFKL